MNNYDLQKYAKDIQHFRGVFMRNALPKNPKKNECAIVNLDNVNGSGTHWVAYKKVGNSVIYYDSFGNLPPPLELVSYFGKKVIIKYNYKQDQSYTSIKCGHLCLKFLYNEH